VQRQDGENLVDAPHVRRLEHGQVAEILVGELAGDLIVHHARRRVRREAVMHLAADLVVERLASRALGEFDVAGEVEGHRLASRTLASS
jgi:hypothetical protein